LESVVAVALSTHGQASSVISATSNSTSRLDAAHVAGVTAITRTASLAATMTWIATVAPRTTRRIFQVTALVFVTAAMAGTAKTASSATFHSTSLKIAALATPDSAAMGIRVWHLASTTVITRLAASSRVQSKETALATLTACSEMRQLAASATASLDTTRQ
jgi:hypothetical protein